MISISSVIELLIGLLIKLSRQTKNLTDNNSIINPLVIMHITNAINSSKNYIYMSMKKTNNLRSHSSTVA